MKSSNIGGQAVLEGIMMKNRDRYAVAVRKPDGEIFVQTEEFHSVTGRYKKLTTIPFIRGVFNFIDSMVLGIKTLTFSASFYEEEEEEKEFSEAEQKKKEKQESLLMAGTVAFSIVAAVAIFMILPYFLSSLMKPVVPSYHLRTVIEGFVRIGIFIIYILLISRMEDIQRTFMYHGAEHKCINCIEHGREIEVKPEVVAKFKPETVKGSQFKQPLLEFSGACAGCGETPYAKLITQLFGDRMYIANATGCSSIWGNSSPSTPYTMNSKGQGPAWSNSLFEDNAEFGYGMLLAQKAIRKRLKEEVETVVASEQASAEVKAACQEYLDTFTCGVTNGDATDKLVAALDGCDCDTCKDIVKNKDFLAKKSQWIFGGDGWAYDIGFGGVDHVLASGEDINIMVFDTEVYSNTGGQSSKATKTGATAQFAAGGKETKKKDLASMAMSYGYVYVAQIAMGGDFNQTVKAIAEAEAYPGPSLIIAYAPCINHGIKKGMSKAQTEEQLAVECGYWNNFRFNPAAEKGSKFTLDSKQPKEEDYQAFLDGEVRYNALKRANPEKAARLFAKNEAEAMERYDYLSKLTDLYKVED